MSVQIVMKQPRKRNAEPREVQWFVGDDAITAARTFIFNNPGKRYYIATQSPDVPKLSAEQFKVPGYRDGFVNRRPSYLIGG